MARDAPAVRSILADHGFSIVQATGYNPQLTHPDDDLLAAELDRLQRRLRHRARRSARR